jgi:hypothetical protein
MPMLKVEVRVLAESILVTPHITTQQHPFFSFSSSCGSGSRMDSFGFSAAVGVAGTCESRILGIVVYPPCSVPLVPGLLFVLRGLASGLPSGHLLLVCISVGPLFSSGLSFSLSPLKSRLKGRSISSVLSSLNSRSYAVPILPSFSHFSCANLLACVGSIC